MYNINQIKYKNTYFLFVWETERTKCYKVLVFYLDLTED